MNYQTNQSQKQAMSNSLWEQEIVAQMGAEKAKEVLANPDNYRVVQGIIMPIMKKN